MSRSIVRILHMSDTHSHVDPTGVAVDLGTQLGSVVLPCGGYEALHAYIHTQKRLALRDGAQLIVTHSGDFFEGSIYFTIFRERCDAVALRKLGVELCTIGNHEFDRGDDLLGRFLKKARVQVLAANLDVSKLAEDAPLRKPHSRFYPYSRDVERMFVMRDHSEVKIAFIGLTHPGMHEIAAPSANLSFIDPIRIMPTVVSAARERGANAIVVLSHMGIERDRILAAEVPGIDLILGGHTHLLQGDFSFTKLPHSGEYGEKVNGTVIAHPGSNANSIGQCSLIFDGKKLDQIVGTNTVLFGRNQIQSAGVASGLAKPARRRLLQALSSKPSVAVVREDIAFKRWLDRRFRRKTRSAAGNVIAISAIPHAYSRVPEHLSPHPSVIDLVARSMLIHGRRDADLNPIAVINAGAVRCALPAGDVSVAFVHGRLLPFPVRLCRSILTGSELLTMISSAIANALQSPNGNGSFPWCAGIVIKHDVRSDRQIAVTAWKTSADGRVEPLDQNDIFTVFTTSYMARGMEGYNLLASKPHDVVGPVIGEVFEAVIRRAGFGALTGQALDGLNDKHY